LIQHEFLTLVAPKGGLAIKYLPQVDPSLLCQPLHLNLMGPSSPLVILSNGCMAKQSEHCAGNVFPQGCTLDCAQSYLKACGPFTPTLRWIRDVWRARAELDKRRPPSRKTDGSMPSRSVTWAKSRKNGDRREGMSPSTENAKRWLKL
jgi:hypothetical protein